MTTSFENLSHDVSNNRGNPDSTDSRSKSSSSSCNHCVNVVREILGGLNRYAANHNSSKNHDINSLYSNQRHDDRRESPPLTLLKAIAGKQDLQQDESEEPIQVENTHDGMRITLPVSATLPTVLRRWNSIAQKSSGVIASNSSAGEETTNMLDDESSATHGLHALATSPVETPPSALASTDDDGGKRLTVEVKCRPCASSGPEGGARAFLMGPTPTSIVLCQNRIQATHHEVEEILTHELVHLFDLQNLKLDLQKCENLAYSEVRAAKAAECRDTWSQYMKSFCVKQKAICATNNLFPAEGRKCIQKVFQHAYEDNRPFQ